jgi:hypothetical protein
MGLTPRPILLPVDGLLGRLRPKALGPDRSLLPLKEFFKVHRTRACGNALSEIGRAATTMRLGIADATPTTATDEVPCRYVGQCDGWQRRCDTGRHHLWKRRFSLKGPDRLAI